MSRRAGTGPRESIQRSYYQQHHGTGLITISIKGEGIENPEMEFSTRKIFVTPAPNLRPGGGIVMLRMRGGILSHLTPTQLLESQALFER